MNKDLKNLQDYREITVNQLNNEIRPRLLEFSGYLCMICQKELTDSACVDHQHLLSREELGVNQGGLIRGVLCDNCNRLEGKIWNNIHRFGHSDSEDPIGSRVRFLQSLISYYLDNWSHKERILHPSERRPEKLGKREYNNLIKLYKSLPSSYKRNGDLKDPPKFTGRWSPKLRELESLLKK